MVYSKEDCNAANNLLPKLLGIKDSLDDLDSAKLLLLTIEIQKELAVKYDKIEIEELITINQTDNDWKSIKSKLDEIYRDDMMSENEYYCFCMNLIYRV